MEYFSTHLCCYLSTDLFLGLSQAFLGQFCPAVTVSNEGLQVIHRLRQQGDLLPNRQSEYISSTKHKRSKWLQEHQRDSEVVMKRYLWTCVYTRDRIFPINTAWNYQAVNYQTIYSKNHLRQAQRTDLSPWRQSHNLHEVPGHGFSCTRQDPCATAKTKADISQISIRRYGIKNVIVVVQYFSYIIYCSMNSGCIWAVRPVSYVLTVPERMSWGQQFRRWLLQTRSSVNLTLCRVSSPATVQKKDQSEKPNILWEGARCQLLWQRLQ